MRSIIDLHRSELYLASFLNTKLDVKWMVKVEMFRLVRASWLRDD